MLWTFLFLCAVTSFLAGLLGYLKAVQLYHTTKDKGWNMPYPHPYYLISNIGINAITILLAIHGIVKYYIAM